MRDCVIVSGARELSWNSGSSQSMSTSSVFVMKSGGDSQKSITGAWVSTL